MPHKPGKKMSDYTPKEMEKIRKETGGKKPKGHK